MGILIKDLREKIINEKDVKMFRHKKLKVWLFIAIAAFLCWIGIGRLVNFAQEYSIQQHALTQVQNLVAEADNINDFPDLNSLKVNRDNLQKTINIVEKIPNFPGFPYQKAQKNLSELRFRLEKVESKIRIEEQALASLQSAHQLNEEAVELVRDKIDSQTSWQEAENKWEQAKKIYQNIPNDTFAAQAVKKDLATYQRTYNEYIALRDFKLANDIAIKAAQLTSDSYFTVADLMNDTVGLINAKSQWELVIKLLSNLSSETIGFRKAQSKLNDYRENYRTVSEAIDIIERCKVDKLTPERLCSEDISLRISKPFGDTTFLIGKGEPLPCKEDNQTGCVIPRTRSICGGNYEWVGYDLRYEDYKWTYGRGWNGYRRSDYLDCEKCAEFRIDGIKDSWC